MTTCSGGITDATLTHPQATVDGNTMDLVFEALGFLAKAAIGLLVVVGVVAVVKFVCNIGRGIYP